MPGAVFVRVDIGADRAGRAGAGIHGRGRFIQNPGSCDVVGMMFHGFTKKGERLPAHPCARLLLICQAVMFSDWKDSKARTRSNCQGALEMLSARKAIAPCFR